MKTTRKRYTGEFKARVALEAIRGDLMLVELATKRGIHPTTIATWMRQGGHHTAPVIPHGTTRTTATSTPHA